jgi:hypothetical protein
MPHSSRRGPGSGPGNLNCCTQNSEMRAPTECKTGSVQNGNGVGPKRGRNGAETGSKRGRSKKRGRSMRMYYSARRLGEMPGGHLHARADAVQQRAGDAAQVTLNIARGAARLAGHLAAGRRVHRRHQHELRGLWVLVVSRASSSVSGGRIVANRLGSIDLPAPGGPMSTTSTFPIPGGLYILSSAC